MVYRVRQAGREDFAVVLGFHRDLYVDFRQSVVPADEVILGEYRDLETVLAEDVRAMLAADRARVYLAEDQDGPCGYISGRVQDEERRVLRRRGVVEDWYVNPTRRGQGVGKELFEVLKAWFMSRGCEVIESSSWPANRASRAIHEGLGFREVEIKYRCRLT